MTERKMDRPLETLFDILTTEQRVACVPDKDTPHEQGFLEKSVDGNFVTYLCEQQQLLTMHRVSHWLRGNAKLFRAEYDTSMSRHLDSLADDLDYLSDIHTDWWNKGEFCGGK